jgi:ABC-type multidrug transport system fused ATPase/permease subunit
MTSSKKDTSDEDWTVEVTDVDQYIDVVKASEMEEGEKRSTNPEPDNPARTDKDDHDHTSRSSITKGVERSTLRFQDLNFLVGSVGHPQTHILSDVSGTVHHGDVLAIMGPSGAGKLCGNVFVDRHKQNILVSSHLSFPPVSQRENNIDQCLDLGCPVW